VDGGTCLTIPTTPTPTPTPASSAAFTCTEMSNGVCYYNQRDPRWTNYPISCGDGTSTKPLGYNGCGKTVLAMLLSTYVDPSYTPDKVIRTWFKNGNYCNGGTAGLEFQILGQFGFKIQALTLDDAQVLEYVKNGWKVWEGILIDNTFSHHTLVVGGDTKPIYNDPWYGPGTTLSGVNKKVTDTILIKPPGQ